MEIHRLNREFIEANELIGKSKVIEKIKAFVNKAALVNYSILITGETGVGKELVARKIHELSDRKGKLFIPLNCANLPENLVESELFGFRKFAFTDAKKDKTGLIEVADGGSLFFDEIPELTLYHQAKLLRIIETKEIRRLGETTPKKIDVRFIFATNKDLKEEIKEGKFRKDLYYRINILEFYIRPLKERKEDIPLLVENILKVENAKNATGKLISQKALSKLLQYDYPGNIRELENILKRAYVFSEGNVITEEDIELNILVDKKKQYMPEELYKKMVNEKEIFWEVVHKPFLQRELNRREVKEIIAFGLRNTKNSYKKLLSLFNIPQEKNNYKRFMNILRVHKLNID